MSPPSSANAAAYTCIYSSAKKKKAIRKETFVQTMKSLFVGIIILLGIFCVFQYWSRNATVRIGIIPNTILVPSSSIQMSGTCDECVNVMMMKSWNITILALNCHMASQTCELFIDYSSSIIYKMQTHLNSTFFFRQLPLNMTLSSILSSRYKTRATSAITSIHQQIFTTTVPLDVITSIFWPFDSNYDDLYNVYNGVSQYGASLSSSAGITGYGNALSVNRFQYIEIASPPLSLVNRSFTVEAWVNPGAGMASNDFLILAQCSDTTEGIPFRCFNIILRYGQPMISFYYGGDCTANTTLSMNRWTHLAFVHDVHKQQQFIYVNGKLSGFNNASGLYTGSSETSLVIGGSTKLNMYFNGLIDQLSLVTRVKSSAEILEDATLTIHYTFDSNIFLHDSGPNRLNGTVMNVNVVSNGRLNEAGSFNTSLSYFQTYDSVLFSTTNLPYSFSLWVYPYANTNGTILLWKDSSCVSLLGFTSSGMLHIRHRISRTPVYIGVNSSYPIPLNIWTHIAYTYSSTVGLRLYVNGTLTGSTTPCHFYSSSHMTLTLGSCLNSTFCSCLSGPIIMGPYYGMIDDFRLYSRQLNDADIFALANP